MNFYKWLGTLFFITLVLFIGLKVRGLIGILFFASILIIIVLRLLTTIRYQKIDHESVDSITQRLIQILKIEDKNIEYIIDVNIECCSSEKLEKNKGYLIRIKSKNKVVRMSCLVHELFHVKLRHNDIPLYFQKVACFLNLLFDFFVWIYEIKYYKKIKNDKEILSLTS